MGMPAIQRLEINAVFDGYRYAQPRGGHYLVPDGWYPLLGLPGSLDIQHNAVLFCRLQKPLEAAVQKYCLNGVIEKIRIHRSARVNGRHTMLMLASDLIREFEVCQLPLLSDSEAKELIETIQPGSGNQVPAMEAGNIATGKAL